MAYSFPDEKILQYSNFIRDGIQQYVLTAFSLVVHTQHYKTISLLTQLAIDRVQLASQLVTIPALYRDCLPCVRCHCYLILCVCVYRAIARLVTCTHITCTLPMPYIETASQRWADWRVHVHCAVR